MLLLLTKSHMSPMMIKPEIRPSPNMSPPPPVRISSASCKVGHVQFVVCPCTQTITSNTLKSTTVFKKRIMACRVSIVSVFNTWASRAF